MHIPRTKREEWAAEVVAQCNPELEERISRGALYRNMYLTGDENGAPATYNKTFSYIDNLQSFLFSPVELRYMMKFRNGGNLSQRAVGRAAMAEMHDLMQDADVYSVIGECVKWALTKGKSIFKMNWEGGAFAPHLVQPEFFGVLLPNVHDLHSQPAFTHTSYYTPSQFAVAFRALGDELPTIMRKLAKNRGRPDERPQRANALKQIVLGGLNPFTQAGQSPAQASSRGIVDWLGGPQATFDPKVLATLIKVDELWAKDDATDDWATFHMVGNVMVTGGDELRNAFADMWDPENKAKRLPDDYRKSNPLSYLHPFVEFCPDPLDGYFWGRSEICNVGTLQMQINARLNGIARLLRLQERPPRLYTGSSGITQQKYSALNKPDGFYVDSSPQAKAQSIYPELPNGLWESLHELIEMFDEMSGLPPVLRGRGEQGVRAQGHAQQLTRNASPRFKKRALAVERSVAEVGTLGLALLRAMDPAERVAWVMPETENPAAKLPPDQPELEAPAAGMKQLPWTFHGVEKDVKVHIDSHSTSPIFSDEARALIFDMVKAGMIQPEEAIEHLHPSGEDEMIADIERKQISQQKLIAQHPELLGELLGGRKKKK